MEVVAALPPCFQSRARKLDAVWSRAGTSVEIDVVVGHEVIVLPVAAQQGARVEVNDVVGQDEGGVVFFARAHELMLRAEGKDVVPDDVVAAVVLMKAGALGPIN